MSSDFEKQLAAFKQQETDERQRTANAAQAAADEQARQAAQQNELEEKYSRKLETAMAQLGTPVLETIPKYLGGSLYAVATEGSLHQKSIEQTWCRTSEEGRLQTITVKIGFGPRIDPKVDSYRVSIGGNFNYEQPLTIKASGGIDLTKLEEARKYVETHVASCCGELTRRKH